MFLLCLHQNAGRVFYSQKKPSTRVCKLEKNIFCIIFLQIFCFLCFFSILAQKMLKIKILTSVWMLQYPNAGQNIQHSVDIFPKFLRKAVVSHKINSRFSIHSRSSLRLASQMSRLRRVTRQMIVYLSTLSLGILKSFSSLALNVKSSHWSS